MSRRSTSRRSLPSRCAQPVASTPYPRPYPGPTSDPTPALPPTLLPTLPPTQVRGRLVSCFDLFINVGILAGYLIGWVLMPKSGAARGLGDLPGPDDVLGGEENAAAAASSAWRWMLGLGTLPPAAILLSLAWLPESPRYLVATGKEAAAAEVRPHLPP